MQDKMDVVKTVVRCLGVEGCIAVHEKVVGYGVSKALVPFHGDVWEYHDVDVYHVFTGERIGVVVPWANGVDATAWFAPVGREDEVVGYAWIGGEMTMASQFRVDVMKFGWDTAEVMHGRIGFDEYEQRQAERQQQ